jgi:hypothetical protein
MKDPQYFYVRHDVKFTSNRQPSVIKWTPVFSLEVEENVEWRQFISLSIFKHGGKGLTKPVSDTYTKVKPIIKETFLDHYTLALKYIHESPIDDGEFYLYQHSKDWYEVTYFSKTEKDKRGIEIDFRDGIEDLWLMFNGFPGHKNRPKFRKNGKPLTEEIFRQFLNLTIQYFYDPDSVTIYLEDYIKNFRSLCAGDNKIQGFVISANKAFEAIIQQLELRKQHIEKQLIESHSDSSVDRAKLRGELEGINYAIKTINNNK